MSLAAYGAYRDSGVAWLGDVPAHWSNSRVRFAVRLNPSKSEVAHRARDEEVSFVPMDAVGENGSVRLDETRPLAEVEAGYTYFRDGDVVVAKITPCFDSGRRHHVGSLVGVGFGTTELIVVRPSGQTSAGSHLALALKFDLFQQPLGEGAM